MYNGSPATNLNLLLNKAYTYQFSYSPDPAVESPEVYYSLTNRHGSADAYARVSDNGYLRLFHPTNGVPLQLTVTVNGVSSEPCTINITSSFEITGYTEIKPFKKDIYLSSQKPYYMIHNLYYGSYVPFQSGFSGLWKFSKNFSDFYLKIDPAMDSIYPEKYDYYGSVDISGNYTNPGGLTTNTFNYTIHYVRQETPANQVTAIDDVKLNVGDRYYNIQANLLPENTTTQYDSLDFFYESSDEGVCHVDEYGNLFAQSPGEATITAKYKGSLNGIALGSSNYEHTTTVTVEGSNGEPNEGEVTGITTSTNGPVYLVPSSAGPDALTTEIIDVSLEPEGIEADYVTSVSPESVAKIQDDGNGKITVTAVSDGEAEITIAAGNIVKTINVIVSSGMWTADSIIISSTSPDSYTVTINNLKRNPGMSGNIYLNNVSIFTWTGPDQNDMQCVRIEDFPNGLNSISHTFTVNGNSPNTWYYNADDIKINVYASDNNSVGDFVDYGIHSWQDATNNVNHNV